MIHSNKNLIIKFILLCLLTIGYFIYLSIKYDVITGGIASILTWSFFVLCTPIADAGFLLDFPLRLLFNIRMFISEIVIWGIAISTNILVINYYKDYYDKTTLTKIFYVILTKPYPYWGIIILSAIGTFLSIKFGDELMDIIQKHNDRTFYNQHHIKHKIIIMITFFIITIVCYYELMKSLDLKKYL